MARDKTRPGPLEDARRAATGWDWPELDAPASADCSWDELVADGANAAEIGLVVEDDRYASRGIDCLSRYLKDIGRYKLLTREDEVALGERIAAATAARARVTAGDLTLEDAERMRFEEVIAAGEAAVRTLVEANLRLAVSIAARHRGRGLDFLDLIAHANRGLMRAAKKYDHTRGFKFSTYATWWIRQSIARGLADEGRLIRLPVHRHEIATRAFAAQAAFEARYGRAPSPAEAARLLDLSEREAARVLAETTRPVALPADPDTEFCARNRLTYEIEDEIVSRSCAAVIRAVLATLTPTEQVILERRFGFGTGSPETLAEIGRDLGVTRERIRQIETRALERLRHPSRLAVLATIADFEPQQQTKKKAS